jgi:hypothetical protein
MHTMRTMQPSQEQSGKWVFATSVGLVSMLFLLAVSIAGWTVNTAYQSAHWQKREQAALTRQKELQEKLATSRSLQTALTFAQQEGFVTASTVGTLNVSQPMAQNVVIR